MKIEIVGAGCENCKRMYEVVKSIIDKHKLTHEIEYISGTDGMKRLIELGVMQSPAMVINNTVALIGFSKDTSKIEKTILGSNY
jgi:hypothetical protein